MKRWADLVDVKFFRNCGVHFLNTEVVGLLVDKKTAPIVNVPRRVGHSKWVMNGAAFFVHRDSGLEEKDIFCSHTQLSIEDYIFTRLQRPFLRSRSTFS